MAVQSPDPSRCALCGEPNECGMAKGNSECWCFDATIPQKALDLVPLAARNKVCICAKCAAKNAESETAKA